jgi:hypothetical protein
MVTQRVEFDPLEFLRLADELATDGADEAALRTAVGRVYYAVFLMARAKTGIRGRHQVHERIRQAISPVDDQAASMLGSMSYFRMVADYELIPGNPQFQGWQTVWSRVRRDAATVIAALSRLPDLAAETEEHA